MDHGEAGDVEVAAACLGEPARHVLPVLDILERSARQHEIVVSRKAAFVVLVEASRRLQLTPGLAEERDVFAVILDLHMRKEGLADELVVPHSAAPVEQNEAVVFPG